MWNNIPYQGVAKAKHWIAFSLRSTDDDDDEVLRELASFSTDEGSDPKAGFNCSWIRWVGMLLNHGTFSHMHTLTACTPTMHTPQSNTSRTLTICKCARHTRICTRPHTPHPTHTPCITHTLTYMYPSHVHPPTSGVHHEVGVGKEHATTMQKIKVLDPLLFYLVHECVRAMCTETS